MKLVPTCTHISKLAQGTLLAISPTAHTVGVPRLPLPGQDAGPWGSHIRLGIRRLTLNFPRRATEILPNYGTRFPHLWNGFIRLA